MCISCVHYLRLYKNECGKWWAWPINPEVGPLEHPCKFFFLMRNPSAAQYWWTYITLKISMERSSFDIHTGHYWMKTRKVKIYPEPLYRISNQRNTATESWKDKDSSINIIKRDKRNGKATTENKINIPEKYGNPGANQLEICHQSTYWPTSQVYLKVSRVNLYPPAWK